MFHVKHPLQFCCSIFRAMLIVLGKNFTQPIRFSFSSQDSIGEEWALAITPKSEVAR